MRAFGATEGEHVRGASVLGTPREEERKEREGGTQVLASVFNQKGRGHLVMPCSQKGRVFWLGACATIANC